VKVSDLPVQDASAMAHKRTAFRIDEASAIGDRDARPERQPLSILVVAKGTPFATRPVTASIVEIGSLNGNCYVRHKVGDCERVVNVLSSSIANSAFLKTLTKVETDAPLFSINLSCNGSSCRAATLRQ